MAALVLGEQQRVRQGGEHGRRRVGVAALLDADEVVDAHAGQRGDLLPAEARGATTAGVSEADVGRLQALPARPQESTQVDVLGHLPSVPGGGPDEPGPRSTRVTAAFLAGRPPRIVLAMQTTTTSTTLPLVPGRWALDPAHSSVGFAVRHLGVAKVRGRFTAFETDVVIGTTVADTHVSATVQLASIDTGNVDRDAHCRSSDLLDVDQRPTLTFRSTALEGDGADWTLEGEVTIGDVTRPVSLAVELGGVQDFIDGSRHAGFEATGELKRTDFGIAPGMPAAMLGDVIKLQLDLELVEPTA